MEGDKKEKNMNEENVIKDIKKFLVNISEKYNIYISKIETFPLQEFWINASSVEGIKYIPAGTVSFECFGK